MDRSVLQGVHRVAPLKFRVKRVDKLLGIHVAVHVQKVRLPEIPMTDGCSGDRTIAFGVAVISADKVERSLDAAQRGLNRQFGVGQNLVQVWRRERGIDSTDRSVKRIVTGAEGDESANGPAAVAFELAWLPRIRRLRGLREPPQLGGENRVGAVQHLR